jgi:hypothetical protein
MPALFSALQNATLRALFQEGRHWKKHFMCKHRMRIVQQSKERPDMPRRSLSSMRM